MPKPKNPPPPIIFNPSIYPDNESDYVSEKGVWTSKGKKQLEKIRDKLNEGYKLKSFKSLEIKISYNCGDSRGMTGSDCDRRAKNAINNTIKRLLELGLKSPKEMFKIKEINAFFQNKDEPAEKGRIKITITPTK